MVFKHLQTFENFNSHKCQAAKNLVNFVKELGINVSTDDVESFIDNIAGPDLQVIVAKIKPIVINENFVEDLASWWSTLGNYQTTLHNNALITLCITVSFLYLLDEKMLTAKIEVKKLIIKEVEKILKEKSLYNSNLPNAVFKKALLDVVSELKRDETLMKNIKNRQHQ